ncbi:MAG: metallophosphoesterase [Candidatus Moraniibacteriota bacterium]
MDHWSIIENKVKIKKLNPFLILKMIFLFLFILSFILLSGHFFLYFTLINFLNISNPNLKLWLGVIFFILSFSFLLASVWAHYSVGAPAKITYRIFSFWLGLGWNLTMAFLFSWLIVAIFKITGYNFDPKYYLFFISFILATTYSIWGLWNAYHPQIKNISLEIKNLPASWQDKKIIQLSDLHLGHIYGENFLQEVVDKVNAEEPDMVFITGDLFDGMDGELDYLVAPLKKLKAPNGIYFVTGNHETYLGIERTYKTLEKTPLRILKNESVEVDGVQIVGVEYPEMREKNGFEKNLKKVKDFQPEAFNILLYHSPDSVREARERGIDLQFSGHTHRGQVFPFGLITYLIYGPYHSGLIQEGDFNLYTSVGTGSWGPMMRTSGQSEIGIFEFNSLK